MQISLNNEIPSATKFNITLNDVPNPRSAITINLNKFIIKISYRNESTILSSSFYQTNQAQFLTFIDNNQDLLINEGREIVLSQGVYSEKFVIQPFEKDARFTNNLYLSSALPGFVMIPEENLIKIGDFSAEFSIGVDQDIINSVYSFNLIIQTLSLIGNYNNLNKIYVFVTNNKIRIDIPSEIVVPFGGCNLPYNLNFEKPPLERIDFSFFSADKIFGDLIKVDSEYSKMNYRIDKNNKIINFAFCRQYNSLSLSKFTVNVRFSGNNAESYYLSKDYFDVRFENLNDQMGTEPEIKLQSFQVIVPNLT